jgi:hypothetical protein
MSSQSRRAALLLSGRGVLGARLTPLLAALGVAWAPGTVAGQIATFPPGRPPHIWLDAEGEPLPIQSDADILEFLRTATVVSRQRIPIGVNRPEKLLLEENGFRAHAAFRVADQRQRDVRIGARFYFDFRDSYRHECAAYELARSLGLDFVPPATLRQIDGTEGSIQIWLENALSLEGREPPDVRAWVTQVWDRDLFDNLILNVDRNLGNLFVDPQQRLWLIDHTRAFQPEDQLLDPERVARIRRSVWERLVAMTEDDLKALVGEYLDHGQISALAKRRELLVEHVQRLVAERGEQAVFF